MTDDPPEHDAPDLLTSTRREGGRATVVVRGQLDLLSAPELEAVVAEARTDGVDEVLLDLTDVDFIDSAGLWTLVHADRDATAAGARVVVRPGVRLLRLLDVSGLPLRVEALDGAPPHPHGQAAATLRLVHEPGQRTHPGGTHG